MRESSSIGSDSENDCNNIIINGPGILLTLRKILFWERITFYNITTRIFFSLLRVFVLRVASGNKLTRILKHYYLTELISVQQIHSQNNGRSEVREDICRAV